MPVSSRTARQPRPSTSSTCARGDDEARSSGPRFATERERERESRGGHWGRGTACCLTSHARSLSAAARARRARRRVLRRRRGLGGEARLARRDEAAVLEPRDRGGGSGIREPIHRRKRLQRRRAAASLLARVRRERVQASTAGARSPSRRAIATRLSGTIPLESEASIADRSSAAARSAAPATAPRPAPRCRPSCGASAADDPPYAWRVWACPASRENHSAPAVRGAPQIDRPQPRGQKSREETERAPSGPHHQMYNERRPTACHLACCRTATASARPKTRRELLAARKAVAREIAIKAAFAIEHASAGAGIHPGASPQVCATAARRRDRAALVEAPKRRTSRTSTRA